jgi:putative transposase
MCMDKGYDFEEVRKLVAEFGSTAHIPVRGQPTENLKKKILSHGDGLSNAPTLG